MCGGERGIRTLDTFNRIHAFQASSIGLSDISPVCFDAVSGLPESGAQGYVTWRPDAIDKA